MSPIPKLRQSFHFQNITGTLKMDMFSENLQLPPYYYRKFEIKKCLN